MATPPPRWCSAGRRRRGGLRAPARGAGGLRVDPRAGPGLGLGAAPVHRRADRGVGWARRRGPVRPRAADRADRRAGGRRLTGTDLLGALLAQVQRCNGGPMTDDVALCPRVDPQIAGSPPRAGERPAPRAPRLTLRIRLTAILGLVALLLVARSAPSSCCRAASATSATTSWSASTRPSSPSATCGPSLVDQESGVRGYALAGDRGSSNPTSGARARRPMPPRLAELLDDSPWPTRSAPSTS